MVLFYESCRKNGSRRREGDIDDFQSMMVAAMKVVVIVIQSVMASAAAAILDRDQAADGGEEGDDSQEDQYKNHMIGFSPRVRRQAPSSTLLKGGLHTRHRAAMGCFPHIKASDGFAVVAGT
jgi:hypothetical protein